MGTRNSSATLTPRLEAISSPLERGRLALIGLLLALSVVGWLVTGDRMDGMDAGPGTALGSLGFYVISWVVMMAAMMFPSISPMVLAYRRVERRRSELGRAMPGSTALFVAGYLVSWTVFGLFAYALLEVIASLSIGWLSWDDGGRYIAGGIIVAAAVYQLTPAKDVCLTHCRSPLDFVLGYWRNGRAGALWMGVEHGAWCVGCCWALMAALFALGVMSVGWMLFVAGLIAIEKLLPWKAIANRGISLVLVALGLAVALAPGQVPALTLPDSAAARDAMMRMDGGSSKMDDGSMKDQPGSMKDRPKKEMPSGSMK